MFTELDITSITVHKICKNMVAFIEKRKHIKTQRSFAVITVLIF